MSRSRGPLPREPPLPPLERKRARPVAFVLHHGVFGHPYELSELARLLTNLGEV